VIDEGDKRSPMTLEHGPHQPEAATTGKRGERLIDACNFGSVPGYVLLVPHASYDAQEAHSGLYGTAQ